MKLLTTVIDLPHSMYTIQDAPREIRRKVVRILAICFAVLVHELYCSTVLKAIEYLAAIPHHLTYHIYHLADIIIAPTLPRTIAI